MRTEGSLMSSQGGERLEGESGSLIRRKQPPQPQDTRERLAKSVRKGNWGRGKCVKGPERDGSRGGTDLSMDCVLPVESGATRDSDDVANMWWDKELSWPGGH